MDEYTVTINGVSHTMLLSKEDAERYGDAAQKGASSTTTKAKQPVNKAKA